MTDAQNIRQEPDGTNWIEINRNSHYVLWECLETGQEAMTMTPEYVAQVEAYARLNEQPIATVIRVANKYLP